MKRRSMGRRTKVISPKLAPGKKIMVEVRVVTKMEICLGVRDLRGRLVTVLPLRGEWGEER